MATLPDGTDQFWFLGADTASREKSAPAPTPTPRPSPGGRRRDESEGRWGLTDFPGSNDDTMPGLNTIEQLGKRFNLASAPVSPAPPGAGGARRPAALPSVHTAPGQRPPDADSDPAPPSTARITVELPPLGRQGRPRDEVRPVRHRHGEVRQTWESRYIRLMALGDIAVGLLAGGAAFAVRFGTEVTDYNSWYLALSLVLPVGLVLVLALNRAYDRRYLFVGSGEYERVLRAGVALVAAIALVSYLLDIRLARGYVLLALPLSTVACLGVRFLLRKQLHAARVRGRNLNRVIVVGHEPAIVSITRQLRRERYHGFNVVGCCLPAGHNGQVGLPIYGTLDQVPRAVEAAGADTVIVLSCPELDGDALRRLAWKLERADIDMIVASSLVDVAGARTTIRPVDGLPMLHVEHPRLDGTGRVCKTLFDRAVALMMLLVLSPLLVAIGVAVRRDSPGPLLFRQIRVGKNGHEFIMFKFRTMYVDAEHGWSSCAQRAIRRAVQDAPRSAGHRGRPVAASLLARRVATVDERAPGEMSLVGPRPPLPSESTCTPTDMRRRLR